MNCSYDSGESAACAERQSLFSRLQADEREQRDCEQRHESTGGHGYDPLERTVYCKRCRRPEMHMSEEPKRRLADRLGMSPTVISESTTVVGDIETHGPLMVSGHVQRRRQDRRHVERGQERALGGRHHAPARRCIAGKVTGKIVVEDKLEISASAVISGEIVAKILAIANGARIEGEVTVTSGKPILKFEEKRAG